MGLGVIVSPEDKMDPSTHLFTQYTRLSTSLFTQYTHSVYLIMYVLYYNVDVQDSC